MLKEVDKVAVRNYFQKLFIPWPHAIFLYSYSFTPFETYSAIMLLRDLY